jgi:ankyrin repeat protein
VLRSRFAADLFAAEVNVRDDEGRTALHAAVQLGAVERVQFLLAVGAEVDAADPDGETPLLTAVTSPWGTAEIIGLLRRYGADPTCAAEDGISPLSLAAATDDPEIRSAFADLLDKPVGRNLGLAGR